MIESLPVFGICGYSGSGKTTLLAKVVPRLLQIGLRVVVVKHDVHGIVRDKSGKDSDRLFRIGADVVVHGPAESLGRYSDDAVLSLEYELGQLAERYDLILLEGFKHLPCRKVWLLGSEESSLPDGVEPCDAVLPWDAERSATLEAMLIGFLSDVADRTPVFGCVLIGGHSTRMGRPKHLLPCDKDTGETWLHRTVRVMQQACGQVVLAGQGVVPPELQGISHLVDAPETEGPLAGLLAALRWAPRASWLLVACDLPCLSGEAVRWILAQRAPGVWAVLPRVDHSAPVEPLLAWYDFRCRSVLESSAVTERRGLQELAGHPKARVVAVPAALANAWNDADTPQEVALVLSTLPTTG